ncbi:MAG: hypothetical protein K0S41_1428 [Anaerocolumna sp.]|jgi:hypothetical protein|nr:hypothetical protein [Anaerocolumna sp.]
MKHVAVGLLICIFWYVFVDISLGIFNAGNNNEIVFSILYLCVIVGVSTSLILDELKKKKDQ